MTVSLTRDLAPKRDGEHTETTALEQEKKNSPSFSSPSLCARGRYRPHRQTAPRISFFPPKKASYVRMSPRSVRWRAVRCLFFLSAWVTPVPPRRHLGGRSLGHRPWWSILFHYCFLVSPSLCFDLRANMSTVGAPPTKRPKNRKPISEHKKSGVGWPLERPIKRALY